MSENIPKETLPLILNVCSSFDEPVDCVLFGANKNMKLDNFGNVPPKNYYTKINIYSGIPDLPYMQAIANVINTPLECGMIRMINTNTSKQTEEEFKIINRSGSQEISTSHKFKQQQPTKEIEYLVSEKDLEGIGELVYDIKIDGDVEFQYKQLPNSTTTFYFYPKF